MNCKPCLRQPSLIDVRTRRSSSSAASPARATSNSTPARERLAKLARAKPIVVFCQVGLRGYLARRILQQAGFNDVRNLSGGYKTWAWAVEKQSNPDIFDYEDIKRRAPPSAPRPSSRQPSLVSGQRQLDAVGLQCPGPILKTYKAMAALESATSWKSSRPTPPSAATSAPGRTRPGTPARRQDRQGLHHRRCCARRPACRRACLAAACSAPLREQTTLVVFSADLDKVMASLIIANGALAMGKPVACSSPSGASTSCAAPTPRRSTSPSWTPCSA
jgi:rhodanese-related sulfurtransferase